MGKLNRTISPPRMNSSGGGFMSFEFSDFRSLDMQKYTAAVRQQVNNMIREHIANALSTAISETQSKLHYNSRGEYGSESLEDRIADSLLWHFKQGANQYQSAFSMKGFIGEGSVNPMMTGYIGNRAFADWKARQEQESGVVVSSKGYGLGLKREGKGTPKVIHPGWKGMKTMEMLLRNAIRAMGNTSELEMNLSRIDLPEQREGWHGGGQGTQQSLGAYGNLKGQ